jgi:hypothetical protein
MFHELSSEPVFAVAFAGWAYLVVRAGARPSTARFALVGLGVAVLAFARPGNAVLLAFVVFPLVVRGTWRKKLSWAAVFVAAAVLPLSAWSVHNGVRFGEYTLARGGNAILPFYRAFIVDKIVSPENGTASRRLARAVDEHLLTREPYHSWRSDATTSSPPAASASTRTSISFRTRYSAGIRTTRCSETRASKPCARTRSPTRAQSSTPSGSS